MLHLLTYLYILKCVYRYKREEEPLKFFFFFCFSIFPVINLLLWFFFYQKKKLFKKNYHTKPTNFISLKEFTMKG